MTRTTSTQTIAPTNVSAAESIGTANKGKSFPAPAPVQLQAKPIQRNPKAKESIKQPDKEIQSKKIPDLTEKMELMISKIPSGKEEGQFILNNLLLYLYYAGTVDSLLKTQCRYVHSNGGGKYGLTEISGTKDEDPIIVTIYRSAFEAGPEVVYSTLRHELIHVGQRLLVPDEKEADSNDDYMHENIYNKNVGQNTTKTIQINLQEIETHTWEILHSKETGVNEKYIEATIKDLLHYSGNLVNNIPKLSKEQFLYWKGYFKKAIEMLINTINYTKNEQLIKITEGLTHAVDNFKTN